MKFSRLIILSLLLVSCKSTISNSNIPPEPPVKPFVAKVKFESLVSVPPRTINIPFTYPAGVSNQVWAVSASSNLVNWFVYPTNWYYIGSNYIQVTNSYPQMYFHIWFPHGL